MSARPPSSIGAVSAGLDPDLGQDLGPNPDPCRGGSAGNQTLKLEPQPQVVVALGFLMTNCAPFRSSL